MYTSFLHGIEERTEDQISRHLISNFDLCSEQIRSKDEQCLKRQTRISLTIRRVEKTSKISIGILKK